jgi:phosphonate transport system permease protein
VAREANISIIDQLTNYLLWFYKLIEKQAFEGLIHTLLLTIMAVACTAVFCVISIPLLVSMQNNWAVNQLGNTFLLLMRSTPEYILAFVLLLVFGPSMLPAVIALAMHNSGLISYLLERYIRQMQRLKPRVTDMNITATFSTFMYKQMPSLYMHFISLLMYRAEIILRESAILGMLGVTTLGFYIDSAFEDLRFDRAFALLLITAALNVLVDQLSRKMQLIFTDTGIRVRSKD